MRQAFIIAMLFGAAIWEWAVATSWYNTPSPSHFQLALILFMALMGVPLVVVAILESRK